MSYKTTGLKRKRSRSAYQGLPRLMGPPKPPRTGRRFVPGRDRVGGFYGRYSNGGEMKFHDVDLDDAVVAGAGGITATINIIAQGVTESTRVGRKCTIKAIHWRYKVNLPQQDAGGTPLNGDTLRIILYLDKQCNGATAAITDILETANVQSFRNLANVSRFNILLDKLHNINYHNMASDGAGLVSLSNQTYQTTFNKRCDIPIEFNNVANDGSLATIRSNNLGVLLISEAGVVGFFSAFRLRFSDA